MGFLVTEDSSKDASSLVQCSQDRVQTALPVPADRWRGGQHDCQHRDGWSVWQHQATDWLPALHPGGCHQWRECALRQEQRLLQPVRGLSLHSIYVDVEIYTDVQNCTLKVFLIKPLIHSMHAFILSGGASKYSV